MLYQDLLRRGLSALALGLALLCALSGVALARAAVGEQLGSAVDIVYEVSGVPGKLSARSNIPLVTVVPRRSTATVTLMREAPGDDTLSPVTIGPVEFAADPAAVTGFQPQETMPLDMTGGIRLSPGMVFIAGDVIFFHLRDEGRNHQPDVVETVELALEGANGDREVFRVSAAGPDSADFYGYALAVPPGQASPGDGRLAVVANDVVTLTYDDPFDIADIASASAVIEPHLMVFDTVTGLPVDGATLTVRAAAGDEAITAYGIDGYAPLAGAVVSGTATSDTRGRVYRAAAGEAPMPYLKPGRYRLDVEPPPGYVFPSDSADGALAVLPGGPYRIAPGARGLVFDHASPGPLRFDVPLDRRGVLVLRKTASVETVARGDFVTFRLTLDNDDDRLAAGAMITDTLPPGFRFEPGTLRLDGARATDPLAGGDGGSLLIPLGDLEAGGTRAAQYVARVGAGARIGPAPSRASARARGGFRSNSAEAMVTVVDGLGAGTATVLGRVILGACGELGKGLPAARLLMEDGRHVVTDARGRFHLDALSPGAHVLRLDTHSLGEDLVPVACPGALRPGETARKRLLEGGGGLLRRVTFRLIPGEGKASETAETAPEAAGPVHDEAFLATLPKALRIVYPAEGASLDDPSLRIGVAYPMGQRVSLRVGGQPVSGLSAEKTIANRGARMAMKRWRGIDLPDGETLVEAIVTDADGAEIERVERRIHYVTEPARAEFLPDRSVLVADGKTPPRIAVRLTDKAGRPVHGGRRITLSIDPPYQARGSQERFEANPLGAPAETLAALTVERDGVGMLELVPTTRSGQARLRLQLAGRDVVLRPWLEPAPRPWVLVGLAEGSAGYNTVTGNMVAAGRAGLTEGIVTAGRAAFFAKGAIRGDWLLTLAYDSDKRWRERETPFADTIDPQAYYPVYGDASEQGSSAPSGYPLYVRLEKGQFHATFGDFDTALDRTQLGAYQRSLSGFKTVYEGERFSIVAFAAEADQTHRRTELPVTAGIGPYPLGARDILRNTERVRLVTRDRDRLSTVITERTLAPFTDYMVDYPGGTIQLRRPPGATDSAFNPIFLVVDYELAAPDTDAITAGGRGALRLFGDALEIGGTVLHEAGGGIDTSGDLGALDLTARIGEHFTLEAEAAGSRAARDGTERSGTALRAEATHAGGWHRARVYFQQTDEGFGLGQQSGAETGRRVIGAEGRVRFDPFAREETTEGDFTLSGAVARDEDLLTRTFRDSAEMLLSRAFTLEGHGQAEAGIGYRGLRDRLSDGTTRTVHRIVGRGATDVLGGRARLAIEREQAVARTGTGWEPDSTTLSIDTRITERLRASVSVQAFDGEDIDAANLHASISADPWSGGTVRFGLGGIRDALGDGAEQVAATVGVGQSVSITERLSASLSAEHVQQLGGVASPAAARFARSLPAETATNLSAGLGYGAEGWNASTRLDLRKTETRRSARAFAGAVGDVTEALTLSFGAEAGLTRPDRSADRWEGTLRFGMAWRPGDGPLSALQKLELSFADDTTREMTAIHLLSAEYRAGERLTLAGAHGARYRQTRIEGDTLDALTQFGALDAYYALDPRWSLGLHGRALVSGMGEEVAFGYGGSVGYSPREGMSLRLGYNVEGFSDEDFSLASTTARGPFIAVVLNIDETDIAAALGGLRGGAEE